MNIELFFKGLVVGFLISTPVGPIGVLCIQRTLNKGKLHGIVSGLGAATADAIYGFIAALLLVAGVFVGAGLWWLILSGITATFLRKLLYSRPAWLNKISGIVILVFGLFVLFTLIT